MGAFNRLTTYDGLLGLGLLGLAVFAWLPDSYFRMVSWPWILVWQGAFWLVLGACTWQLRRFNQPFYRLGFGFDWLMVGLLVGLIMGSSLSPFPVLALQNSLLVGCYLILLYGLHNSRFTAVQLCQGLVGVGAIAAIISLVLWRPTPDMWLSDNFYDAIRNRFPLGHHNFTGGYFVLVLPIAATMAWLQSGWQRWSYATLSLAIAGALYASGSRGAWLGGIAVTGLALVGGMLQSHGKNRLRIIALSGVMVCLILALLGSNPRIRALVSWHNDVPNTNRSDVVASVTPKVMADGPTLDRVFMGQAAFNILKDRPLLGLGPGNLGRVYERYRPLAAGTGLNQVQQLHNTPLQITAELGAWGALIYLGTLTCLGRLIYKLQKLSGGKDRRLSLGIAMGFLGYGISSLSDYQLENIPIAATLIVLLAALTRLGDSLTSHAVASDAVALKVISPSNRRWGSLLILLMVALISQFWLRSDLALWMTHQGLASIRQSQLTQADDKFYKAATLTPWDPTPSALGAQQLSELAKTATDNNQTILREQAIELYQQVLTAAPNDIWFNQNLAVLAWQTGDITTAHQAIAKVVQLSPRSKNFSYYLLGLTYQQLGNTDAAIAAFALECLINPQVLLFDSWQQDLALLKAQVFAQALQHYQTVLSNLESNHPLKNALETHIMALRWWLGSTENKPGSTNQATSQAKHDERLLTQALFNIETAPDTADHLLDDCITSVPADASSCRLLKAWLRPEYLTEYLKTADLKPADQTMLQSHITTHRDLRDWLQSTTQPVSNNQRVALALLYRSYYAQKISSILLPDDLRQFSLPLSLKLFTLAWPREFAPLDQLVETIRAETLGLPHPTRNNFQFTAPSPLEAS
ncbi:O-antigen ligase family protein [Leptothoe sp. PORK10 BA2]|uniref:O-antigen ligase family protein n=1 Tax=Leptothoe sp. PORK10 BA2 TaxID=3110254 RepID=UPI002B1FF681|nr:O-antigen ligase family protein [Leptothoe sp. PORK10 BA2]MEA5464693.1 O-antigen ligase family protein [Leptothoe sp. PORK10 BA2]